MPDDKVAREPEEKPKPTSPTKRKSLSQHEKKKATKAKIMVPPVKKEPAQEVVAEPATVVAGMPAAEDFSDDATMGGFAPMVDEPSFAEFSDGAYGAPVSHRGGFPFEVGSAAANGHENEGDFERGDNREGQGDNRENKDGRQQKRRSVKKKRLWPKVLCAVLGVLAVAVVGAFSWYRWFYGDDVADMLGTWNVPGGEAPIVVEGGSIVLAEDVSYAYALDEDAKTITFTFGQMKGQGYYHFSPDRNTLVIQDGVFTWMDTLTSDISWTVDELIAFVSGGEQPVPEGENVIVLVRAATAV